MAALVLLASMLGACGQQDLTGRMQRSGSARAGLPIEARFVENDASCPAPRCFEMDIPLPEGLVVTDNRVRIIVPADYTSSHRHYPVLYLLHDAPGDYLSWTQLGGVFESLKDLDVIAIMPDGGGGKPGWYSDWEDGSFHWESYHMGVMLPYLEERLRTLGDGHRAVAGPSMGGFGAMHYSSRHPGVFAAAGAISGAVDFLHADRASAMYAYLGNAFAGTPNGPVWGDPVTNYPVWQAHDPGTHVAGLAGMQIFLSCGNGLPGGPYEAPDHPELYGVEVLVEQMNLAFEQTLANAGVEHVTWFYGPGFHDWPYYRDAFAWMLPQLVPVITP